MYSVTLSARITPVSYTHLDVYKRQGPIIPEDQPVFHFDSTKEDEDDEFEDDYEPFPEPEEE